ncbi:MAG: hypothetical protein Q9182_006841 [Xanthomendoza sp. 2 TL-2023]
MKFPGGLMPFLSIFAAPVVAALDSFYTNTGFVRDQCYNRTLRLLMDGFLTADDEVFARDHTGTPMSNPGSLTLTLPGCERLCGSKRGWYTDIGPRLSVWLIPSLLLISNMELSPLDKRRFFAILHLLGDPIDSLGSLIDKLASWERCFRVAAQRKYCSRCTRAIATVYAGFEESEGARVMQGLAHNGDPEGQVALETRLDSYFDGLAVRYNLTSRFQEWRRTALELANNRTDEFLRTGLAIVLYVYQIIGGFVAAIGGEPSSPPGGRIATGVLLSWLIPTVLLSNVIGNFPSQISLNDILARFSANTGGILAEPRIESTAFSNLPALKKHSSDSSVEALSWTGGIYTFRPWRHHHLKGPRRLQTSWWRITLTELLSVLPVTVGIIGASLILWNLIPNGLNCRHTWSIAVFIAWVVSAIITRVSYAPGFATGKYHWYFVVAKDALIAIPSVIIMFLSACGLFNDCKCWSGYLYYRISPRVPLNTHPFFRHNDSTLYQYIVWSCLALQGVLFIIIATKWQQGLKVFRWSERARREERWRMLSAYLCVCLGR